MRVTARILICSVISIACATIALTPGDAFAQQQSRDGFPAGPKAQILSFTASATLIQPGRSVTLEWAVINADRIALDRGIGIVAARGSRTVTPTVTTTYTL